MNCARRRFSSRNVGSAWLLLFDNADWLCYAVYHPKMPKHLPPLLFLSRASKHIVKTILLWLRFVLVCFVWLGILPWVVRWMWRFWFWLGDGGWAWWRKRPFFVDVINPPNTTFTETISDVIVGVNTTMDLMEDGGDLGDLGSGTLFANITRHPTLKYGWIYPLCLPA